MHLKMLKKGQIAIFLIIGILIIIAGAFYFYATTFTTESRIETRLAEVQEVSADFNPVKEFVDQCIYSTALEGLRLIGENGGYTSIDPSKNNIKSEKLYPASGDRTAYWFYADSSIPFVQKPKLRESDPKSGISIEKQISDYVKSNLNSCLNNFDEFKKQGFSINEGKLATEALIRDSDVLINANYPLKIEKGDSKVDIEDFFVTIPFNMRAIYELASAVADNQSNNRYLEKYTNTLIFVYSGPESNKLPVTSELRFDFTPSFWIEHRVEEDLKDILNTNIQQLRVLGSRNYVPYGDDDLITRGIYDGLETLPLHTGAASFATYDIRFEYLPGFFPFKFNVCDGAVCRSESGLGPIPAVGFQRSLFSYDVEYPVFVEIRDPSAIIFGNEGYKFNLFLQSKILDNNPYMEKASPQTIIPTGLAIDDIANQPPSASLFDGPTICSPDLWDSEEILIIPVNASDESRKIPNAQIYFTAAEVSCPIGSTDSEGRLITRLPTGTFGGAITATAEGFVDKSIMYDPGISHETEVKIRLEPIAAKKYVVYKKKFRKVNYGGTSYWNFEGASLPLSPKENAIITLDRVPAEGEPEFSAFGEFNGDMYATPPEMDIAPGNYNLSINMILNDLVVIPKSEIEFWKPKFPALWNKDKVEIPEISFGEAPMEKLHIAKLTGLSAGSYEYKIKCITPPLRKPDGTPILEGYKPSLVDYGSVKFRVSGNAAAVVPLQIISKTPVYRSGKAYLIVETNKDTKCQYKPSGAQNFLNFDHDGKLHIVGVSIPERGTIAFSVECLDGSSWMQLGQPIEIKKGAPLQQAFFPTMEGFEFSTDEAFIAVETSAETTCRYADSAELMSSLSLNPLMSEAAKISKYKSFSGVTDANFPEGGLDMGNVVFTAEDLYKPGNLEFVVIDLGIDDVGNDPGDTLVKEIEDLEQLDKIEDYSKRYRGNLLPYVR